MKCDRIREAASARLDGEPLGMSETVLDEHLRCCPDCAAWLAAATAITRQLRLSADTDVPDLAATLQHDVVEPARKVDRRRRLLRAGLATVGVAQLAIAIPAIAGDSLGMAMAAHAAHEGAAWNLAIAVAFLAAAWQPRRSAGLVPLLATFMVVLAVLSVHDVVAGQVGLARIATHLAALLGLLLLVAADRTERSLPPRRTATAGDEPEQRRHLRGVA